jgi:hypothetical protein
MTRRIIIDSGGTARTITRRFVIDSGGTARLINRRFVIDSGGTARLTYIGDVISISDLLVTATVSSGTATAVYTLKASGDIYITNGTNTIVDSGSDWISPQTNMAAYEARVTVLSGSLTAGTSGSWLSLGSDQTWTRNDTLGGGSSICSFTLEIRRASDGTVMASGSITLEAERI